MSSKVYCHPCSRKDFSSAADKYCTDCEENMCSNCVTAHNSFKAFTSHRLVDSSVAPTSKLPIQKTCSKHQDMALDFFCADHDCLCCRLCMSESHRICQKFVPLDIAAKGVKKSATLEDVNSTLSNIRETLTKMFETRENNLKYLEDDRNKVLIEFAAVKADILKKLNEAEDEFNLQVKSTAKEYKSRIETQKDSILQVANEVDEVIGQIDFATEYGSESQIFIVMNSCKWEIVRHHTKLREIIQTLENIRISFHRKTVDISDWKKFGSIKVTSIPCNIKYTTTKMNQAQVLPAVLPSYKSPSTVCVPTKFAFHRQFDVKSDEIAYISSIAVTDDNRLLLCNRYETELLTYNDNGDYLQDCTLKGEPWDIAVIPGKDRAVVSLSYSSEIQFINTKSMKPGSTHDVPGECYGITIVNDKICVGGYQEIYILSKQGKYETTITVPMFSNIFYLHPGPPGSVLYTTNSKYVSTFGCVKLTGEIIFIYTDDNFVGPAAVITDNGGKIYIACTDSNNIHRLTSEGKCTDIILTNNKGIDRPYGLAFSKDYSKLFVSNKDGKEILVFSCK